MSWIFLNSFVIEVDIAGFHAYKEVFGSIVVPVYRPLSAKKCLGLALVAAKEKNANDHKG